MFQSADHVPLLSPFLQFGQAAEMGPQLFVKTLAYPHQSNLPFTITSFDVLPGCATPVDQHAVEETWHIIIGDGKLIFDGTSYSVRENDWLYFPSHKTHQLVNEGQQTIKVISIYW